MDRAQIKNFFIKWEKGGKLISKDDYLLVL